MRKFDHNSTWEDVQNMTIEEAIAVLSHDADSDGKEWSARPHKAKAAQMAIEALKRLIMKIMSRLYSFKWQISSGVRLS